MVSKGKTKIKFFQSLMSIFHQFIAYLCFFCLFYIQYAVFKSFRLPENFRQPEKDLTSFAFLLC